MDSKFIIDIKGKKFLKFEGLLNEAKENGLEGSNIEILQYPTKDNDNTIIVKSTIILNGKYYSDIGDANSKNVNSIIIPHIIRQASTRATARALRIGLGIGMCSVEELGEITEEPPYEDSKELQVEVPNVCSSCGIEIDDKVKEFSIKKFGKTLCFKCQRI